MNIIYAMILLALLLSLSFLGVFVYCVRKGQFDDLDIEAQKILIDED